MLSLFIIELCLVPEIKYYLLTYLLLKSAITLCVILHYSLIVRTMNPWLESSTLTFTLWTHSHEARKMEWLSIMDTGTCLAACFLAFGRLSWPHWRVSRPTGTLNIDGEVRTAFNSSICRGANLTWSPRLNRFSSRGLVFGRIYS